MRENSSIVILQTVDGQFILSFTHRFIEVKGATTYFAFCFPWSYTEQQNRLAELDNKYQRCISYDSKT